MSRYKHDADVGLLGDPVADEFIATRENGSIRRWQPDYPPICAVCGKRKPCPCEENEASQANRALCGER